MQFIYTVLIALAVLAGGSVARAQDTVPLRVMTFNVWYGGVQVEFQRVGEAIRAARADVVAVDEPEGSLRRIAEAAGLSYVDESLHLISRFPLFPAERDGVRFAFVAIAPDRVVAIACVHLSATPYGPEAVRDGQTLEEVMALEEGLRVAEITPYIAPFTALAAEGVPGFIAGDFNTPSHLDWTEAVKAVREQVRYPVAWPTTKVMADAGFHDSYRDAHPDPVARPGFTWTAGTPPPFVRPEETLDRIDLVMAVGPATTTASELVGEAGGPDVDIAVMPWPSDHRAVVSTFDVVPAAGPALVAAEPRVVRAGERVVVRYLAPGLDEGRTIGLRAAGGDYGPLATLPIYDATDHRAGLFGTATLPPGAYEAVLLAGNGTVEASTPVWIQPADAKPGIAVAEAEVAAGAPVMVRWTNAPGNKLDWVGLFAGGDPDAYNYYAFAYVGALPEGELVFDEAAVGGPLDPGTYEVRLLLDDGYAVLAAAPFAVK